MSEEKMEVPKGQSICNQIRDAVKRSVIHDGEQRQAVWLACDVARLVRREQATEMRHAPPNVVGPWMLDDIRLYERPAVPSGHFYVMLDQQFPKSGPPQEAHDVP